MNRHGTLFERLACRADQKTHSARDEALMDSVAAHLSRMLSTRAGSVQTLPDYGLPDLNDMRLSLHEVLRQSRKAIEDFVRTYEPRLSDVRVISESRDDPAPGLLFCIEGVLNIDGCKKPVVLSASLESRGKVRVSCN